MEIIFRKSLLCNLKIPRYLFLNKIIWRFEIYEFCDAILKAFVACIYFRIIYLDNSASSSLIFSKFRVAPLKLISLPRLELCFMVILVKLMQVNKVFENRMRINSVNLWSDSQIALWWIDSHPSRWNVFVANRISQIQKLSSNCTWGYICSSE